MSALEDEIVSLEHLPTHELKIAWRRLYRSEPPRCLPRDLMIRALAYRMQERAHGRLAPATKRKLRSLVAELEAKGTQVFDPGVTLKPGARLVREWAGETHTVIVLEEGFERRALSFAHEDCGQDHRRALVRPALLRHRQEAGPASGYSGLRQ